MNLLRPKSYAALDFEEDKNLGKQNRELQIVDAVLRRLGFDSFQLTAADKPDVFANFDHPQSQPLLGCEVMSFQSDVGPRGSDLRRFRARWSRVMGPVITSLQQKFGSAPYCTVTFAALKPGLDGMDEKLCTAELITVGSLLRHQPRVTFPHQATPTLNHWLHEVTVIDPDGRGLLWWPTHLQSGPVEPLDAATRQAVQGKIRLARNYNWKGASERWLLLHAPAHGLTDLFGGARKSTLGRIPRPAPFTAVVIWDKFSEDIWTAFPAFRVICNGSRQTRDHEALPISLRSVARSDRHYPTRPKPR